MENALKYAMLLLDLAPAFTAGLTSVVAKFDEGRKAVKKMVEEKRDPTEEEWDLLNEATAMLRDSLHSDDH
jgi:hypothetical protein